MPRIQQDVHERGSHFARTLQRADVIPVLEHGTSTSPETVEGAGEAHEQTLHAAREPSAVVDLRDEVDVSRLDGELAHAKPETLVRGRERRDDHVPRDSAPETRKALAEPNGRVERKS
jgi:hypothetical protein